MTSQSTWMQEQTMVMRNGSVELVGVVGVDIVVEGCLRRDATMGLVGRKCTGINIDQESLRAVKPSTKVRL